VFNTPLSTFTNVPSTSQHCYLSKFSGYTSAKNWWLRNWTLNLPHTMHEH